MLEDIFQTILNYYSTLPGTVAYETNGYNGFKICGKMYSEVKKTTNYISILVKRKFVTDEEINILNISLIYLGKWTLDTELRIEDNSHLEPYYKIIERAYNGTKDEYNVKVKKSIEEAIAKDQDYIMQFAEDQEYAFDMLLNKWNEFKEYKISNSELDELKTDFQTLDKFKSEEFLNRYINNEVKYKFLTVIFELVSYIDKNAYNKGIYNKYEDNRTLALTFVRQNDWVSNLINYKKYSDLTKVTEVVRNVIFYIINPEKRISGYKTSMIVQFCKYLIPGSNIENDYEFLCNMIYKYFEQMDIKVVNEKNRGIVYGRLMFSGIMVKEWNVENNYWKIQPYKDSDLLREEVKNNLDNNIIVSKDKSLTRSASNNIFYAAEDNKVLFLGIFTNKAVDGGNGFYKREYKIISITDNDINILPKDKPWGSKFSSKTFINVKIEEREEFEREVINGLFEKDIDNILHEIKSMTNGNKVISSDADDMGNNTDGEDEGVENGGIYDPEIDTPLNIILYGPPGTGKTYNSVNYAVSIVDKKEVDEVMGESKTNRKDVFDRYKKYVSDKKIIFTTFHQSYGYEEFIQGIRANTNNTDQLSFIKEDGIFKDLVERAKADPKGNYVIIIDEINRGNISRIFGELITLIEEDKRLGRENETYVTLPSKEAFGVPGNIFIIGTMNTADKSIALIDVALRRRFDFIAMYPDYKVIPEFEGILRPINNAIYERKRSADYLIGHAFFVNKKIDDLGSIVNKKLIPILNEYFYTNINDVKEILSKGGIEVEMDVDTFQLKYIGVEA